MKVLGVRHVTAELAAPGKVTPGAGDTYAALIDAVVDATRDVESLRAEREKAVALLIDRADVLRTAKLRQAEAMTALDAYIRDRATRPQ